MAERETLECWVYVSQSLLTGENVAEQVARIVEVSRRRNLELCITGALILTGNRFAQLIEGPSESIALLRRAICADPRHRRVTTILAAAQDRRLFEGWALVYSGHSRYMAGLLDEVVLEADMQKGAIQGAILTMFDAFASDRDEGH